VAERELAGSGRRLALAGGLAAAAGADVPGEVGLDGELADAELRGDPGDGEPLDAEGSGLLAALIGAGGGRGSLPGPCLTARRPDRTP
jgi:hypothetical protein